MSLLVELDPMQQFLIVKTSAIGDVIHSLHVIDLIKSRFPDCAIDWVVEKGIAPLLRAHPHIDRVLEVDTKLWRKSPWKHRQSIGAFKKELCQKKYDVLFDLQGNTKSALICAMAKARKKVGYSWTTVAEKPNYFATNIHIPVLQEGNVRTRYSALIMSYFGDYATPEPQTLQLRLNAEEEERLQSLAQLGLERPRLMICFGSNWENKKLSFETLKAFLALIDEKIKPTFLFIYGNTAEKQIAEALGRGYIVGDMSLALWQRLMYTVDGVISMDSASLHLCGTTSTPSFSLFGPSSAHVYKPEGEFHFAFQGSCPYGIQFDKRCPSLRTCSTGACLKSVIAEQLFAEFHQFSERFLAYQKRSPRESSLPQPLPK